MVQLVPDWYKQLPVDKMSQKALDSIPDYSCSEPTGMTIGKMWKRDAHWHYPNLGPLWVVHEIVSHSDPKFVRVLARQVEIVPTETNIDPRIPPKYRFWFTKWYKVESKMIDGSPYWFIVREDKPHSKGTRMGPVRITGKSWYEKAVDECKKRNDKIMAKRSELWKAFVQQGK